MYFDGSVIHSFNAVSCSFTNVCEDDSVLKMDKDGNIDLSGKTKITLTIGSSVLTITKDKVTIKSKNIELDGENNKITGNKNEVNGETTIEGKTVTIKGKPVNIN